MNKMGFKYTWLSLLLTAAFSLTGSTLVTHDYLKLVLRTVGFSAGLAACLRKPEEFLSQLELDRQQLEREREEMNVRYIADTELLEAWADGEKHRLAEEANKIVENEREIAMSTVQETLGECERWKSQAYELQERLSVYQLPRLPSGTSRVEVVAGMVVEFFYQHGILADYVDSWTENEYDLVRVKPRAGGREQFAKLTEELQLELRLDQPPSITLVQGTVQLKFDTKLIDTRPSTGKPTIIEPPTNYLSTVVKAAPSIRINGESGSGKSTLANSLIALMQQELLGSTQSDESLVTLIDPKYPMSTWEIPPMYKGINQALGGLTEAADLVENRLSLAAADKDAGLPIRQFSPRLFVIDEIDWVMTHYGQPAADLLRVTLKVGRALNVMLMYIGQTPLASRLKLNRDDFRHSASFFLGENIPAALDEVVHSSHLKAELTIEYNKRLESGNKYFCLVKYPGKQAFLASLPKPEVVGYQKLSEVTASNSGEILVNSCNQEKRNSAELEANGSKREVTKVTSELTSLTSGISPEMLDIARKALSQGVTKSKIIKELWGFKGGSYKKGVTLWNSSELGGT